jgi:hypothetical protein
MEPLEPHWTSALWTVLWAATALLASLLVQVRVLAFLWVCCRACLVTVKGGLLLGANGGRVAKQPLKGPLLIYAPPHCVGKHSSDVLSLVLVYGYSTVPQLCH